MDPNASILDPNASILALIADLYVQASVAKQRVAELEQQLAEEGESQ
jgi:hypothetical protein